MIEGSLYTFVRPHYFSSVRAKHEEAVKISARATFKIGQ